MLRRAYRYLHPYWKQTASAYASLLVMLIINQFIYPTDHRWIIDTGIGGQQVNVLTWSVPALLGLTLLVE